jgi:transcriptional regulator with XRE-family HTH domain
MRRLPNRGAATLREIQLNRGLKQNQLARELQVDEGRLSRILRSLILPDRALAVRIRDAFWIDPGLWDEPAADQDADATGTDA